MKLMAFALLLALSFSARAHDFDVKVLSTSVAKENHNQDPRQKPFQIRDADRDRGRSERMGVLATCTAPTVANDCCHYELRDDLASATVIYKGPKEVYTTETDAQKFAGEQTPRMAFYFPYAGDEASLTNGWIYEAGGSHSSLDYQKTTVDADTDPTFKVLAVAPGRVVSKLWDNWHGNVLIIEHEAANGTKYRSLYFHLRNGKTNDIAKAKAIPVPADADASVKKYNKFANLSSPSSIHWGTDEQTILVNVGDNVQAGQHIAYSGNTGPGGAGAGLKDDGTPSDNTRANNHLHFMLAVVNPKTAGEWIFVDPFGVYAKASTGCHDLMKDNQFPRFFAPFYPSFHGVKSDVLFKHASYFSNMGAMLQTVSFYPVGANILAAGSFQNEAPNPFHWYGLLNNTQFDQTVVKHVADGFRPRELQVMIDQAGQPRFSVIFQKRQSEGWWAYINMNKTELDAKWNELVTQQGYRMEDFAAYNVGGEVRFAAIYVKDDMPFHFLHGLDANVFNTRFAEYGRQGFANVSFSASNLPEGERFAGIWTKPGGSWATWFGMSPAEYQQKFNEYSAQGFRLHRIQGYANGERFGAIWKK